MPYNFVVDSFHTKKLCSRLSSSKVRFYTENPRFAFLSPQRATYDDRLRLIGKRVVVFLLVLIELFLLGVTADSAWLGGVKFFRRGVPPIGWLYKPLTDFELTTGLKLTLRRRPTFKCQQMHMLLHNCLRF